MLAALLTSWIPPPFKKKLLTLSKLSFVDVSDIFYFSAWGGERGVRGARKGAGSVFC